MIECFAQVDPTESAFTAGVADDGRRTATINSLYGAIVETAALNPDEKHIFMAHAMEELNDALGPDARVFLRRYAGRTLDARADIAMAETFGKIALFRDRSEGYK